MAILEAFGQPEQFHISCLSMNVDGANHHDFSTAEPTLVYLQPKITEVVDEAFGAILKGRQNASERPFLA
jgi:hypothetical protein